MRVKLFATVRALAGARSIDLDMGEAEPPTAIGLLEALVARYPDISALLFDADGALYPHVQLLINGREVRYLPDGLQTRIASDETVDLFPAVGGG